MISIRSIAERELGWFAALHGNPHDELERQLRGLWREGGGRAEWTLVAEAEGDPVGRLALFAEPLGGGLSEPECRLAATWLDRRHSAHLEAARELLGTAGEIAATMAPTILERRLNPEVHDDIPAWRAILEANGFALFQEKAGYLWTDGGELLPAPERVTVRSLAEVGRERYARVMAATTAGTLDRNDRYYIARCRPRPWAEEILGFVQPGDEASCLIGFDSHDDPVGFVALGAFDDEGTATIVHIGVVPEQRGRGYVHELLRAANRAARERSYRSILSDVDTLNVPMRNAMERNGHLPGRRPWHVWHYRRWLGIEAPTEPAAASV